MNHTEFFAQVKAGQLRGAYLFEGTEVRCTVAPCPCGN